jgi:secreted trypsin-like serine protease
VGTAERLLANAKNKNAALIETVGYGTQAIQPHPLDVVIRYRSSSLIVELNGNASKGGILHTLNNPSAVGGVGGSCFGDSGGPVFVNNTNQVIAVVSYGDSSTCHGADYSWRVDTQPSYDFINPFLGG